jgi:hypothetical protein
MKHPLFLAAVIALGVIVAGAACGSQYTVTDRSSIQVSKNARVSAQNLIGNAQKYPTVIEQLALAQEIYQQQLGLLKERRNKVRSRRRTLSALSFGTFAATSTVVAGAELLGEPMSGTTDNVQVGVALGGLAVGTLLQVTGFMQEDSSSVDSKVRQLDLIYDQMIDTLKHLSFQAELASKDGKTTGSFVAEMGAAIENFISEALAINVKG